jgi:hypothetical protein
MHYDYITSFLYEITITSPVPVPMYGYSVEDECLSWFLSFRDMDWLGRLGIARGSCFAFPIGVPIDRVLMASNKHSHLQGEFFVTL